MRILAVEWVDAADTTDGWTQREELDLEVRVTTTVGIELPDVLPGHVVLVQSTCSDMVDNVMQIPMGMIRSTTVLLA